MRACLSALVVVIGLVSTGDASARAARDGCHTHACRDRVLMREYRAHPMPACTWAPESSWDPRTGQSFIGRPWALGRYRVVNPGSGAGGKFQFLPSTWRNIGGRGLPHHAPPVDQERGARKLRRLVGLSAWVNC